jgi:hypothetical protein
MNTEGPQLETLTRRLADTPADFLAAPRVGAQGAVHVAAVVNDLLSELGGIPMTQAQVRQFQPGSASAADRNFLSVVLIACWLLRDEWFRTQPGMAAAALWLLSERLQPLAALVPAAQFVSDPDRREELARFVLAQFDLRPAGESAAQAQDRLTTLSSVERQRVIRAARAAEERSRVIREAMAKKAAEEAADKWNRE